MKTIPITQARQDLFNIVDETILTGTPIEILGKRGGAVLISTDDWNAVQETLYLSHIPGFKESLIEAENGEWVDENEVDW